MRKNRFFKVDTRNRGAKEIEAALKQIKETVGKQEGLAVGALTSENRDVWADVSGGLDRVFCFTAVL
jgi:carnitine O-acetyltransferase